jgi:mannose-6-phosphate isomerase-like protein (cupin superfamily)
MSIADVGPRPQAFDLEAETLENANYRTVAWSGKYLQVTLMSIPVNGVIGLEKHGETDQFIRLDRGRGRAQMGPAEDDLTFDQEVTDGWCVLVPAGSWHNVTNIGDEPMQVYTVYAPQHHTPGKVQATKAIADADTDDAPAEWSVQPDPVADQHA